MSGPKPSGIREWSQLRARIKGVVRNETASNASARSARSGEPAGNEEGSRSDWSRSVSAGTRTGTRLKCSGRCCRTAGHTADDSRRGSGLSVSGDKAAPLRSIGKSRAGAKAVLDRRVGRIGSCGQWQALEPKRRCRVGFPLIGYIREQLRRVAIVRPGQSQVYCEVLADLPVIATIEEGIVLTEIQYRIACSNGNAGEERH